jgi:aryl sulfotransferase
MAGGTRVRYRSVVADSARWEGFAFRPGDIVISTPPKCGTTWTQMICALLIFQAPTFPRSLDLISPWLDMLTRDLDSVVADLEGQRHRRFVKTHTPFDGLPVDDRVTYLCVSRDPRDVALSWDNHMANIDLGAFIEARQAAVGLDDLAELMPDGPPVRADTEVERFWQWVDDDSPVTSGPSSLRGTLHHLATFWAERHRANLVLLRYEDLRADLAGQMQALAARLGIEVAADRWPELVAAATFDSMRARAHEVAPDVTNRLWHDTREFFHRGTTGQWRAVLGDDAGAQARYQARVAALAEPELAAWVHGGPPGAGPG